MAFYKILMRLANLMLDTGNSKRAVLYNGSLAGLRHEKNCFSIGENENQTVELRF